MNTAAFAIAKFVVKISNKLLWISYNKNISALSCIYNKRPLKDGV